MTIEQIAKAIEKPLDVWCGNCHVVCREMLHRGLVDPRSGFIGGSATFASRADFHFWLLLPDGRVVDPTRWCYEETTSPYIYFGPQGPEYYPQPSSEPDAGANRILGR